MGPRSDNRGYASIDAEHRLRIAASMGPRSDNRGYGQLMQHPARMRTAASMGPRSDNRGYERPVLECCTPCSQLQWVHGPITVVMMLWRTSAAEQTSSFNGSTVR